MIPVDLALHIGGLVVSAVVLVLGMKFAMNGLRGDVTEMKSDLKLLVTSDAKQNERLVAVEKEAEGRGGWIRRIEEGLKELRVIVERRLERR